MQLRTLENIWKDSNGMTREEAYKFLEEESSNTQSGLYVYITDVEKVIKSISDNEELKEKALNDIYECEGNTDDWVQLNDAKYFVNIALGI